MADDTPINVNTSINDIFDMVPEGGEVPRHPLDNTEVQAAKIPSPGDVFDTEITKDVQQAAVQSTEAEQKAQEDSDLEVANEVEDEKPKSDVKKTPEVTKRLSFAAGNEKFDVPTTAKVAVKVDGQVKTIALQELVSKYNGAIATEKRFTELDRERKTFRNEQDQYRQEQQKFHEQQTEYKEMLDTLTKQAANGKIFDAIRTLIDISGASDQLDSREFVKHLRTAMRAEAQNLAALSDEQLALLEAREELEYYKGKQETYAKRLEREQAQRASQEQLATLQREYGLSNEQYETGKASRLETAKQMNYQLKDVTPQDVIAHIQNVESHIKAGKALDAVDPSLRKNPKTWDLAAKMVREDPELTEDDVATIFRNAMRDNRSVTVSKKVNKAPVATAAKPALKPAKTNTENVLGPLTWD